MKNSSCHVMGNMTGNFGLVNLFGKHLGADAIRWYFLQSATRQLPNKIPSESIDNSFPFPYRHLGKTEQQVAGLKFYETYFGNF